MSIRALIVGSIILAIGVYMAIQARKKTALLEKYEFENRSSSGVVKFDNIELSQTHEANKGLYKVLTFIGYAVGLVGVALLVAGLGL